MHVVLLCQDKPDSLELRLRTRPAHMDYLAAQGDVVVLAGPFLDEAEQPIGSLFILEVPNLAAAQAFADADPYAGAGLFASVELRPWRWTIKAPDRNAPDRNAPDHRSPDRNAPAR